MNMKNQLKEGEKLVSTDKVLQKKKKRKRKRKIKKLV